MNIINFIFFHSFIFFRIQKLRINAKDHINWSASLDPENPYFDVQVCPELGILIAGGIEIFGKTIII